MKFSVWPGMTIDPSEVLDTARWADANGFHGVWYADHYMPNTGSEEIKAGPTHECWGLLPAMAVVTDRVRIGPLVSPTSVHHPAVLANRAATIDHLSGGRFVLGLGAGWQINEHRAYGIELAPPKPRVDRFEEAIQIVRSMLTQDRTTFDGEYYAITDAPCEPAPLQSPLPLLVGTGGRRMMRITARYADEWNTWGTVEGAAERRAAFVAACESVGVDPTSKRTSVQALIFITDSMEEADRVLSGPMGVRSIAGPVDHLLGELAAYAELGFDEFNVVDANLGSSPAARRDGLERIKTDLIDQL